MMKRAILLLVLLTIVSSSLAQASLVQLPEGDGEYVDWRYVQDLKIRDGGGFNNILQSVYNQLFAVTVSPPQGATRIEVGDTVRLDLDNEFWSTHTKYKIRVWYREVSPSRIVYSKTWTICDNGCDIIIPQGQTLDSSFQAFFTPTVPGRFEVIEYIYTASHNRVQGRQEFLVYEPGSQECPANYCEYTYGDLFNAEEVTGGILVRNTCYTYEFNQQTAVCEQSSHEEYRVNCREGYEASEAGNECVKLEPECTVTEWSPPASEICDGSFFTQTSNCETTRGTYGTKDCTPSCQDSSWSPLASTICEGEQFTQSSNCQNQRTSVGTKVCQTTCTDTNWQPAKNSVCSGEQFTQTSSCQNQRTATGTKDCSSTQCTDSVWTPTRETVCAGEQFTQTSNCQNERAATGLMDCSSTTCTNNEWLPLLSAICSQNTITQTSNCGETRVRQGIKDCTYTCDATVWQPSKTSVCSGVQFEQASNCGTSRFEVGTKDCSVQCDETGWQPGINQVCSGVEFSQTSNCGTTRMMTGAKDCSAPAGDGCTATDWKPSASLYCDDLQFYQVNSCGDTRELIGTKDCTVGSADDNSGENTDETGGGDAFTRLLLIAGALYVGYLVVIKKGGLLQQAKGRRKRR